MKLKLIVDFKFDALYTGNLHREPPEFGLVEKLSRSLYWWVEVTGSAKRYTSLDPPQEEATSPTPKSL